MIVVGSASLALASFQTTSIPLVANYDLDGEAADDNQIVTVVNLANEVLTIAAQPDVCRRITMTLVDTGASIVAGTTTVVGTDCNGDAQTEILDGSGGAGVVTGTSYFESVTSITNASYSVLDGGGDETIIVGVAALDDSSYYFCKMGTLVVDADLIETSGSSTTTTGVVGADDVFDSYSVGDFIGVAGTHPDTGVGGIIWRHITVKTDADTITVNDEWDLSAQVAHYYRPRNCGAGSRDGWISVKDSDQLTYELDIQQMGGSGGITYVVQCKPTDVPGINPTVVIGETNVSAAGTPSASIVTAPWGACRLGFRWETNDDASDSTVEQIYAGAILRR
jgi:hypothetical protein